jgi:tetratricopeptide (TPR) repeat protein
MELVKGIPITRYCDEHHLTPQQRLELFVPVCQAIQHAHQKGIIHRDLKPSNVMVCLYDGRPVPKVIDFGIAKAAGQKLTDRTLFTELGQVVGTLEYMSPEQAELNQLDVDTRSDIYSLGVLLYELLTGTTPLQRGRLKEAAFLEVLRLIREEEPPRPSMRLSDSGAALASISAQRKMEQAKLTKMLRGELDWIVMKALEKDRNRRYETPNGLAQDVERYLNDETVIACPPSAWYRLRKFVRRNKGPVLAAAIVFLVLVGGIVGTTFGLVRAQLAWAAEAERAEGERMATQEMKTERDEKEKARLLAVTQRELAEKNEKRAERQKRIAQAVRKFLQMDLLRMADAWRQADALRLTDGNFKATENPTIKELLDRAAAELTPAKIERKLPGEPLVQAEVLRTIGDTYHATGEFARAIVHLERSRDLLVSQLGADASETLTTRTSLAVAYMDSGDVRKAIQQLEQLRDKTRELHGPDDERTLNTLYGLGTAYLQAGRLKEAIVLFEQVRDKRATKRGLDDRDTLSVLGILAVAYRHAGRLPEAIRLYEMVRDRQTKTLGPNHPATLTTRQNLARAYLFAGKTQEAIRLLEQVRDVVIEWVGRNHPLTLITQVNLAMALHDAGRLPEAINLLIQVRDKCIETLGHRHPETLKTLGSLARSYKGAGRLVEAIRLYEQVRKQMAEQLGHDHPQTLTALHNLAGAYWAAGKKQEAILLYEQVRDTDLTKLGPDNPEILTTLYSLAQFYLDVGRVPEAIRLFEQVHERRNATIGPDEPATLRTRYHLAEAYAKAQRLREAIRLFEHVRDRQTKVLGPNHADTLYTLHSLAEACRDAGRLPQAIRVFEDVSNRMNDTLGAYHVNTVTTLNNLAGAYWAARNLSRSVPLFGEALRRHVKFYGNDHFETIRTAINLGVNYRDAGQLADAVRVFDEWLPRAARVLEPAHPVRGFGRIAGVETYTRAGRLDRAEPLLRETAELVKLQAGAESPRFARQSVDLGVNLLRQQKWIEAEAVFRECVRICEKAEPDSWTTFYNQTFLGGALVGQRKHAAAEPLLLKGYQGMREREAQIPERYRNLHVIDALMQLVRLYEAWDKPDEAARWRARLARKRSQRD